MIILYNIYIYRERERTYCQESAEDLAGNYLEASVNWRLESFFQLGKGVCKIDYFCLQWPTRSERISTPSPHLRRPRLHRCLPENSWWHDSNVIRNAEKTWEEPWEQPSKTWWKIWFLLMLTVAILWNCPRLFSRLKNAETICPYPRYATERFLSRWNPANYITKAPISAWVINPWS